jgi:acetyl/propionyl-CoA carboxylase alpha subunit/acetyl-CoA carboxylase carboxyltransferase component
MRPTLSKVLVANRGEIAVRIIRACADLDVTSVAVHALDEADALHVRRADESRALDGSGPAAYLDIAQVVGAAVDAGCDAVHPGYGFLSERPEFARACAEAGLVFVGPSPETLALFGDKAAGRALAERCGVPVLPGTGPADAATIREFLVALGPDAAVMLKAVAGGGGRGMRPVHDPAVVEAAYERCRSEAQAAFGDGAVYAERLLPHARHIEVQIVGDATGAVVHLGERECSIQRRHQKIVEIAPAPGLPPDLREALLSAAQRVATEAGYTGAGTFEFLVTDPGETDAGEPAHAFIEANARLQVEHTVTEEVTGVDLVQVQLLLAGGATLADLGLTESPAPRGFAVQARVNLETVDRSGAVHPTGGTLEVFEPPTGPGVRVDTFGRAGYRTSGRYDSLLAKVIAHAPSDDVGPALRKAARALGEFRIDGVATNISFLRRILEHPTVLAGRATTAFVEEHLEDLVPETRPEAVPGEPGDGTVSAPVQGTVVALSVAEGDTVPGGGQLLVLEAMKMEHVVIAPGAAVVRRILVSPGDVLRAGQPVVLLEATHDEGPVAVSEEVVDLDAVRPDLAEVHERHAVGLDDARPDAVERRRKTHQRTARENVADLIDPGSLVEYGPLVIAAQRRRRALDDLIARTPADGLIGGLATVDGAPAVVMSYDYTVLAGTQGQQNHRKKDRLFEIAERQRLPLVFFTEGGGGRPGDTDSSGVAGLDCMAFHLFGRLSGLVPLVGIASGRCFAGNAALLGCCDVVIATADSTIGMGGPAMIEGGGLGVYAPDEVGPMDVQVANGVVDVPVADEAEAVAVARRYLSYFTHPQTDWACADQRLLRRVIPENRLRIYDVRAVIETLADTGSVLELRRAWAPGMVTALVRVDGRAMGLVANNPAHLAGAITSDGADKAARFLQLCDAFDLPVLFLCDTPGIMVGPDAERTGLVRHASRLFVTGASLTVPFFTIVLRKGYGLGAQAMAGGSFKAPVFTVSWPTGEFGGMGLEGAVRLGFRNELAAIDDEAERQATFEQMVARMYEHGKAVNTASHFEIDDVIDPVDSRAWISAAIRGWQPEPRTGKKRPCVDTW